MSSGDASSDRESGRPAWGALVLRLPEGLSDALLARFAGRSLGAESFSDEAAETLLKIFFETPAEAEAAAAEATGVIRQRGLDPTGAQLSVEAVRDGRWLERFEAGLRPFPLGARFVVHPGPEGPPGRGRIPIRIVPGRAFGTGRHPTTQLCAELLERRVGAGEHWVDVGCGSGILSVVAGHCGAAEVVALDIDPDALEVARTVVGASSVAERVDIRQGTTADLRSAADGIVANILASFLIEEAISLAASLRPRGTLIASGFLAEEAAEVEAALVAAGLSRVESLQRNEWMAAVFGPPTPSGN